MVSPEGALRPRQGHLPVHPSGFVLAPLLYAGLSSPPRPPPGVGTAETDRAPLTSRGQALPTASPITASDSRPDADAVTRCLPWTDGRPSLASALGLVFPAIPQLTPQGALGRD